jgi:hypothetical protein
MAFGRGRFSRFLGFFLGKELHSEQDFKAVFSAKYARAAPPEF